MPTGPAEAVRDWLEKRKASDGRGGKRDRGPTAGATPAAFYDLKEERLRQDVRKLTAEAENEEFQTAIAKGQLVPMDDARQAIADVLLPLRVLLDSLPKACAIKANPAHPELAEEAIREGLDGVYRQIDQAKVGANHLG